MKLNSKYSTDCNFFNLTGIIGKVEILQYTTNFNLVAKKVISPICSHNKSFFAKLYRRGQEMTVEFSGNQYSCNTDEAESSYQQLKSNWIFLSGVVILKKSWHKDLKFIRPQGYQTSKSIPHYRAKFESFFL